MSSPLVALRAQEIAEQAEEFFSSPRSDGTPSVFMPKSLAGNALGVNESLDLRPTSLEAAFPDVDPGQEPLGNLVLVMIRQPAYRTKAGLLLSDELRQTEHYNTQVAKVIAIGPIAFKNRNTMETWPEGAWCRPGDYVRVPKYQGDRFSVKFEFTDHEPVLGIDGVTRPKQVIDETVFVFFKDLALIGVIKPEHVLSVRAYI